MRDYFAAAALPMAMVKGGAPEDVAKQAYKIAEAMVTARLQSPAGA